MNDHELEAYIAGLESQAHSEEEKNRLLEMQMAYKGDDALVTSEDLWEQIKNEPPEPQMFSQFQNLDKILAGFRRGQLIVLSGITKHGKTSFAIELTTQLKEYEPAWIPLEESARELIRKFHERTETIPHFVTPKVIRDIDLDWVEKKVIEARAKFNSRVVFIDHLGFIAKTERGETLEQAIARTCRTLRQIAERWQVAIVLLVHTRKVALDTNPNLEELKDSSAIGQEADTVIFIWRVTTKDRKTREITVTNFANVSVQANRRTGTTGNVKFLYRDGRYIEYDWAGDLPTSSDDF